MYLKLDPFYTSLSLKICPLDILIHNALEQFRPLQTRSKHRNCNPSVLDMISIALKSYLLSLRPHSNWTIAFTRFLPLLDPKMEIAARPEINRNFEHTYCIKRLHRRRLLYLLPKPRSQGSIFVPVDDGTSNNVLFYRYHFPQVSRDNDVFKPCWILKSLLF
jgi:hypothetical protein